MGWKLGPKGGVFGKEADGIGLGQRRVGVIAKERVDLQKLLPWLQSRSNKIEGDNDSKGTGSDQR